MDFFCPETIGLARFSLFACVAITAAIEDIRTLRVARRPLLVLIALLLFYPDERLSLAIAERMTGCLVALISFSASRFISRGKLGLADVWIAGAIGALGGSLFFAEASFSAIILMLPSKRGCACPFIPALVAGTFLSVFFFPFFGHE